MTERSLIGISIACELAPILRAVRNSGADLDDETPVVDGQGQFAWYFIDPVDHKDINLVRIALGCDSTSDGVLRTWKSREVSHAKVRGFVVWWESLLVDMRACCPQIAVIRHLYAGKFGSEIVEPRVTQEVHRRDDLRRKLQTLGRDEMLILLREGVLDA